MKVYAINLEKSVERKKHIVAQLQKHKLDYELIAAVDGRNLSAAKLERLCDLNAVRARPDKLTPGAIGCALSHLRAYQKMLEDKAETALILEDDAVLPAGINKLLASIEIHLKPREVILLHYFEVRPKKAVLSRRDGEALDEQHELLYPVEFPFSGTGYVIARETAEALCQVKLPINVEADDWKHFYQSGAIKSVRCVYPKPVIVSQAQTQIQPATDYKNTTRWRHKIYKFVSENKTPIVYPLIRKFSMLKEKHFASVAVVDKPSRIFNTEAGDR